MRAGACGRAIRSARPGSSAVHMGAQKNWVGLWGMLYFRLLGLRGPYLLIFLRGFKGPTRELGLGFRGGCLTLSIDIAQKPYIIGSLGPKALN